MVVVPAPLSIALILCHFPMSHSPLLRLVQPLGTIALILSLGACGGPAPSAGADPALNTAPNSTADLGSMASDWQITPSGLGPVEVGMTLAQIKQTLGSDYTFEDQPNFMVDFGAIAVIQAGKPQFYLMYFASEPLTDGDPVGFIHIEDPQFQTPEGIGPGSTLESAESVYGTASLNYNTDNEMREYVSFANQPEDLSFRSDGEPGNFAGLYEGDEGSSYHETQNFRLDARIGSILIDGYRRNQAATPARSASIATEANPASAKPVAAAPDCGDPQTQADINRCAGGSYQESDDRLNETYQTVKANFSAADRETLTDVQLDWLQVRDRFCEAVTYDAQDGSLYPTLLNGCLQHLTESRIQRLGESLETGFFSQGLQSISPGTVTIEGNTLNCDDPQGTPEINYCAQVAYDNADQALNNTYQDLLNGLSPKAQTLLQESQDAWYDYRQRHCDFVTEGAIGGTGFTAYWSACMESLSLEHQQTLQDIPLTGDR